MQRRAIAHAWHAQYLHVKLQQSGTWCPFLKSHSRLHMHGLFGRHPSRSCLYFGWDCAPQTSTTVHQDCPHACRPVQLDGHFVGHMLQAGHVLGCAADVHQIVRSQMRTNMYMYSLLLTYIGRVMTLSCRRRYMRYSHLLGDFRHDFGPQLDLRLRPRCSASAQYHAFRLVQQKAISNT